MDILIQLWVIANLSVTFTPLMIMFCKVPLNFSQKIFYEIAVFCPFDDNMQMRLLTSLKLKYSKVFKFKGFHIKRRPPMGGGWALGPMLGKRE